MPETGSVRRIDYANERVNDIVYINKIPSLLSHAGPVNWKTVTAEYYA